MPARKPAKRAAPVVAVPRRPRKADASPTIGQYLIRRLQDYGVGHVFGIPGDFVLQFYGELQESPLGVIGMTREDCAGYAADAYREIGNRGIQIHGGMGFTWENDVHLYYRRAKVSETMLGDNVFHRERLASMIVDRL